MTISSHTSDGQPAVRLVQVHKRYAGRAILDGIDLAVPRGEFFALLGPSGSGKSTLLKMVSGIETPDMGCVWLAGKDVTRVPSYRRPVHTVFQNYALFPHLNVADNVGFPLRVAGMPRQETAERVHRALGWVRLETFAQRRVDQLSGGEKQRVALARALVDDPEVVLLDEPLSALDPHLRGQTLELLQDIQQRLHATYLYVTHDREEALRAADRIAVLNHGRLEQVGTPEDLYHRPATAFVAGFVGPINWLDGELAGDRIRLGFGAEVPLHDQAKRPANGRRLRVGVRPEHLRLTHDGPIAATVVQRQFAGASVSLRLTVGETTLIADLPGDVSPPAVGATVRVDWAPERSHVFPV